VAEAMWSLRALYPPRLSLHPLVPKIPGRLAIPPLRDGLYPLDESHKEDRL
jgi:hypothetical protein